MEGGAGARVATSSDGGRRRMAVFITVIRKSDILITRQKTLAIIASRAQWENLLDSLNELLRPPCLLSKVKRMVPTPNRVRKVFFTERRR